MKQGDIALAYARQGVAVFPCRMNKSPATKSGFLDATTDESIIRGWWRKNPNYLIGCPNKYFTVLDIDDADVCEAGQALTDNALRLFGKANDVRKAVAVKTMSGGSHMYFAPTPGATRRIKVLPNIDLLGDGGYVILPDQKSYKAERPLWECVKKLPAFPLAFFDKLVVQLAQATRMARDFERAHKGKSPTKSAKKPVRKVVIDENEAADLMEMVLDGTKKPQKRHNSVNYKDGTVSFEQTPNMYKRVDSFSTDSSILSTFDRVNGKLVLKPGDLNSERVNTLFHTDEIQIRLAQLIGLDVPSKSGATLMHSILPGHLDERKSMGVRWSEDGSHLIIRDFSNFFGDALHQVDYNLVRLYTTMCYKALVPRMKPPEFVVWFIRMMVEAGIIDVSHLIRDYALPRFDGEIWTVAEGLQLLDAIKQLYTGYEPSTTFADRFCSAWCGVSPSAANRAKKELHRAGYIKIDGVFDCGAGKREDGFFNTNLMSIISGEINKASNELKEAGIDMADEQNQDKQLITLRGYSISEPDYQLIQNFCTDYKIDNVPLRKNMFVESCLIDGIEKRDPPEGGKDIVIVDLVLEVLPAMGEKGSEVLIASGTSPELEEVFYADCEAALEAESNVISDEPLVAFVVCNDWQGNSVDTETLTIKFNEYLKGRVNMDTFFVRYGTDEAIYDYVYDGKEPPGE